MCVAVGDVVDAVTGGEAARANDAESANVKSAIRPSRMIGSLKTHSVDGATRAVHVQSERAEGHGHVVGHLLVGDPVPIAIEASVVPHRGGQTFTLFVQFVERG